MANGLHDVYGLRIQFRTHGRVWSINLHYQANSLPPSTGGSADLVAVAQGLFTPVLIACIAPSTTLEGFYAWCTLKDTANPAEQPTISTPGEAPLSCLPPNMSVVYTLRSSDEGYKRAGRIYLGGISKAWVLNGSINAAFLTDYEALRQQLSETLQGGVYEWQLGILRKFQGMTEPQAPAKPEPIPLEPNHFFASDNG